MIANLLRLAHSLLIIDIISKIVHGQTCSIVVFGVEIGFTLLRALIERRLFSRHTKFQIIASMVLGYIMFPNKARFISWIFLIKGIQVHQSLKNFRKSFFSGNSFKYVAFTFDVLRFTANQFIFFGAVNLLYRFFTDSVEEPIPDVHVIMYQLAVTGSTIGYGDITPKSKHQMIFFTYAIPILCGSFVVYINSLVEVYTDTFLKEDQPVVEQPPKEKAQ